MAATTLPTNPCLEVLSFQEALIEYFADGFTYLEIKEFLNIYHGIKVSLSTMKRELRRHGLYKRPLINRALYIQELYVSCMGVATS